MNNLAAQGWMVQVNFPTAEFTGTKLLPAREVGYQHPDNSLTRLVYHPSTITYAIKTLTVNQSDSALTEIHSGGVRPSPSKPNEDVGCDEE